MTDARKNAHLDADAITATQEAPTLTVGGLRYRGRLLSIEEWLPFWERLQRLDAEAAVLPAANAPDVVKRRLLARTALYRDYLTAVFPTRQFKWWAPDPVPRVMGLPFVALEETIAFFFILQAQATFGADALHQTGKPPIPGTPSPSKTAAAPIARTGAAP